MKLGNFQTYKFNNWDTGTFAAARNDLTENVPMSGLQKAGVFATAAAGVAATTFAFAKHQKLPVTQIAINGKEVLGIAGASVLGGLAGGIAFDDKKYAKAKAREAFVQYFGNVSIALAFVTGAGKLADKINLKGPAARIVRGVTILGGLLAGVLTGNKVCNFINEKLFGQKVNRCLKPTDAAPHLDDTALAIKYMAGKETLVNSIMTKIIPIALITPGFEVGTCRKVD